MVVSLRRTENQSQRILWLVFEFRVELQKEPIPFNAKNFSLLRYALIFTFVIVCVLDYKSLGPRLE
jgi:hypothetical protein